MTWCSVQNLLHLDFLQAPDFETSVSLLLSLCKKTRTVTFFFQSFNFRKGFFVVFGAVLLMQKRTAEKIRPLSSTNGSFTERVLSLRMIRVFSIF